jgi:hypothetical protein
MKALVSWEVGAQDQEAAVVEVVVDPVGDQHALGQVVVIVSVDALNVAAVALTRAVECPEQLLVSWCRH